MSDHPILRTLYGSKIKYVGPSSWAGLILVEVFGCETHVLVADLDEESKSILAKLGEKVEISGENE